MFNDTIVAISTAMSPSGIGIIRLSGNQSISIVNQLFVMNHMDKSLLTVPSHTINYGLIMDQEKKEVLDEVLVSVMRGPNSYTREDVVEINCHGGIINMQNILKKLLSYELRLAEPGEFTKRAFLNGRIDLSQAEAVMDIISSKTEMSLKSSMNQLRKNLSDKIYEIKNLVLTMIAHIEASIDYPEYDIEDLSEIHLEQDIKKIEEKIINLLESYDTGKIIKEGIKTVIVGKPNVGKSSLLNVLLQEQRAIVTDIPGTTRDILEEYMNVHGIPMKIIDTAGIRHTDDFIEKIGVEKTKEMVQNSDLCLFMVDASQKLTDEDYSIINIIQNRKVIILVNKIDINQTLELNHLNELLPTSKIILCSMKNKEGIDLLEAEIRDLFLEGKVKYQDDVYITNVRHQNALQDAIKSIKCFQQAIEQNMPVDLMAIDLRNVYDFIGQITGDTVKDDLIEQIFSQFCLGK